MDELLDAGYVMSAAWEQMFRSRKPDVTSGNIVGFYPTRMFDVKTGGGGCDVFIQL